MWADSMSSSSSPFARRDETYPNNWRRPNETLSYPPTGDPYGQWGQPAPRGTTLSATLGHYDLAEAFRRQSGHHPPTDSCIGPKDCSAPINEVQYPHSLVNHPVNEFQYPQLHSPPIHVRIPRQPFVQQLPPIQPEAFPPPPPPQALNRYAPYSLYPSHSHTHTQYPLPPGSAPGSQGVGSHRAWCLGRKQARDDLSAKKRLEKLEQREWEDESHRRARALDEQHAERKREKRRVRKLREEARRGEKGMRGEGYWYDEPHIHER